jgi:hypothetical protein
MGLVPPSSWCWRILEVGASGGCNLPNILEKCSVVFSHLGFHVKSVYCACEILIVICCDLAVE